jgi:lipopolysaccharide transport system permease protein
MAFEQGNTQMSMFSPTGHLFAFRELIGLLTRHRQLTWEMTKREISERYVGQIFGTLWTIGHPLALMGIFVFVFAYVFKLKVGGTFELPRDFTTYLLSGLIPWMAFQESMAKGSTVILSNASLVKQVVFPIEILPVKGVIVTFVSQAVSSSVLILYVLIKHGFLPWTYALLPVLFFFQALAMIGVSYVLSSVGVFFRDLKDFVQVFCIAGLYMIPVVYLPKWVPGVVRPILFVNPFSHLVWCYQDICYFGRFEHPWSWGVLMFLSLTVFYGGYRIFIKLKIMFGNVL